MSATPKSPTPGTPCGPAVPAWARCPKCRASLVPDVADWTCTGCTTRYPVISGIPDLRVMPDPWISMLEDRRKGCLVDNEAEPGFEAAVRHYWLLTPETPTVLATRHIDHVLGAVNRTREWIKILSPPPVTGERWLDIGCGTADLAAAAGDTAEVAGLDVAFRWLCVARRRFQGARRHPVLVCGNGEALPVADATFDRIFLIGTVEHVSDLEGLLTEAHRVLRPGGWVHLRTVNRLSLLPEPHVMLWGIGFMPRLVADRYARWRGRGGYRHHWPRTPGQVARALRTAGFREVAVSAAPLLDAERHRLPAPLRWAGGLYQALRRWPGARTFAPLLEAQGRAA